MSLGWGGAFLEIFKQIGGVLNEYGSRHGRVYAKRYF